MTQAPTSRRIMSHGLFALLGMGTSRGYLSNFKDIPHKIKRQKRLALLNKFHQLSMRLSRRARSQDIALRAHGGE
jgi:hypothetical protein